MNEHPSPEFEREVREAFGALDANPTFVHDLRATLLERSKMKQQSRTSARLAWSFAIVVLLIALLIAFPRVVTALKKLLGYVPGVGYVEQGTSLRVLSEPVLVEKDGLKVTVEKGAADSQHTTLLQHVEGYTVERYGMLGCDTPARLRLPDGTILNEVSFETGHEGDKGNSSSGSYYGRYVFEPLPAGIMNATLEVPCVMYDFKYKNWKFALHFQPADESQVMTVIELPTEEPSVPGVSVSTAPPTPPTADTDSSAAETLEGFSIVLESETSLPDGYILSGSLQWTDPRFEFFSIQPVYPKITDAQGREVQYQLVPPAGSVDRAVKKLPFAYQITGKDYAWPLTLTVDTIFVRLPEKGTFEFDAGPNPQVGQTWDVNRDVRVGDHVIHVQTIQLSGGRTPTEFGYDFTMTSDPSVTSATVTDANPVINGPGGYGGGGGGGGGGATVDSFTSGWVIEGYSPAGLKTFVISDVYVSVHGLWQTTWQPTTP